MSLTDGENRMFFFLGIASIVLMIVGTIVCNLAHINFPTKIDGQTYDERAKQQQELRDEEDMALFQYGAGLIIFNIGAGLLIAAMFSVGISGVKEDIQVNSGVDFLKRFTAGLPKTVMLICAAIMMILWVYLILTTTIIEKTIFLHP